MLYMCSSLELSFPHWISFLLKMSYFLILDLVLFSILICWLDQSHILLISFKFIEQVFTSEGVSTFIFVLFLLLYLKCFFFFLLFIPYILIIVSFSLYSSQVLPPLLPSESPLFLIKRHLMNDNNIS